LQNFLYVRGELCREELCQFPLTWKNYCLFRLKNVQIHYLCNDFLKGQTKMYDNKKNNGNCQSNVK